MMDQVKFRAMKDGDAADYAFLTEHEIEYTKGTADRLLRLWFRWMKAFRAIR